ncbi:HSP20-like chaperone [Pseudovirgaria hyperparasitica]|uniref:HSP20-like chaperone n=1 Tax=Pseudovirgaria hyperparasitica TaxID=470096 RepID=A0A6A6W2H6_9PEZI|nr:HSP20-like chaperone [Pseudovirgaria hyperparasitica]KAF2757052.1 HSP20-like chaperone [Pseudovirgaria hyperparasitica]
MSLFPRGFTQEFSPLFRIFDEYDRAMQTARTQSSLPSFTPKFNVSETKEAYQLHGELPGIAQKDINIEWADSNTISISGRTESIREEGTRPNAAGLIEQSGDANKENDSGYHKPTVEEDPTEQSSTPKTEITGQITRTNTNTQVTPKTDTPKFWVSERSVGEFHRSFSFPARVDQDAVKASLKDGILSVVVPKAGKPMSKKINIE